MRFANILILSLMITLLVSCNSQVRKTVIGDYAFKLSPNEARNEILDDSHLTILGFTVGIHSLNAVQEKLGQTKVLPKEEHSSKRICYISDKISDGTILVFEAGPLGGWKYLTAVSLISNKSNFPDIQFCKKISSVSKDVQTLSGLRLGIKKEQFVAMLGEATRETNNRLFYFYSSKREMTKSEIKKIGRQQSLMKEETYLDVLSTVVGELLTSEIISITVSKVESN